MAGLVMLSLIILMVTSLRVVVVKKRGKMFFLKTLIGFFIVMGSFHLYVLNICKPNAKDVKLMKPQVEVIMKYILENGVPQTMSGIPDVPYKLVSCEKPANHMEQCSFTINNNKYRLNLYQSSTLELSAINVNTKTLLIHEFQKSGHHWNLIETKISNIKPSKFCNPLKIHL